MRQRCSVEGSVDRKVAATFPSSSSPATMSSHQPHATTSTLASLSPLNLPSSSTSTSRDTSYLSSLGTTPCAFDDCRLLDFLPLLCTDCGGKYCGEHSTPQQHRCDRRLAPREDGEEAGPAGYLAPRCGFCGDVPRVWQRSAGDKGRHEAVRKHVEGGECSIVKEAFSGPRKAKASSNPECSHRRCHKSLATLRLDCPKCGLGFCAAHREVAKHDCQGAARSMATKNQSTASATPAMKKLALQDTLKPPQTSSPAPSTAPSSSSSTKLPSLPNLGDVLSNRKVDKWVGPPPLFARA